MSIMPSHFHHYSLQSSCQVTSLKVTSCQVTSLKVTSDLTLEVTSDLTLDVSNDLTLDVTCIPYLNSKCEYAHKHSRARVR